MTARYRVTHTRVGMAQGVRTPLAERSDDQLAALVAKATSRLSLSFTSGTSEVSTTSRFARFATARLRLTWSRAPLSRRGLLALPEGSGERQSVAVCGSEEPRHRRAAAAPARCFAVVRSEEEDPIYTIVDESRLADPSVAAHDQELVDLVWESAAALARPDTPARSPPPPGAGRRRALRGAGRRQGRRLHAPDAPTRLARRGGHVVSAHEASARALRRARHAAHAA